MRNKLVICLAALLLTACAPQKTTAETQTSPQISDNPVTAEVITAETEAETTTETTAETTTEVTEEIIEETVDYKFLYSQKLEEIMQSEDYEPSMYAFDIYDIDSDGTPELFVSDGNYHIAGVMIFTVSENGLRQLTYTSEDGENIDQFGSWGSVQVTSDGYISSTYSGMGGAYGSYFFLENGELTHIVSFEEHMFDELSETMPYVINGEAVSEEEYYEAVGGYFQKDWQNMGRGIILESQSIAINLGSACR